ncbi:serine/threonine-protein kinase [Ruania alba]|uniref:non-specific serine/threonine protein kinase n=1 Tax=Ruania alba TaxID=648782 RepID=A0A1H5LS53_9MICO|nr:serine/threonine-protein kinase [Ruania alba]SEE79804.1 serine/threonine protein kinase [Ruania alba]
MTPTAGLLLGGRYELTERLATGGMGEVWVATDLHLRRNVAAKVLRAEFAGDTHFLDRLRTEARNSAALSHQNIAAMYDYGEQRGSGYLIMELVLGESLEDLLRRERTLEPTQVLPVLAQTARALHTAHMAGVVHRDVKPSNILLTRDGYVKITDFGISLGANQAPMTAAGMVMGTAQYLPPEQAMGRAATGAGDIYALGVVAFEALVGRRPFTGGSQVDIAFAHVNQQVPGLPSHLDERVREVVLQMLSKDPEQRPRSAASLARTLEALSDQLRAGTEGYRTDDDPPATSVAAPVRAPAPLAPTPVADSVTDSSTAPATPTKTPPQRGRANPRHRNGGRNNGNGRGNQGCSSRGCRTLRWRPASRRDRRAGRTGHEHRGAPPHAGRSRPARPGPRRPAGPLRQFGLRG